MHLYVLARAQVNRLNEWEGDLNKKFVNYTYGHQHPETGKPDITGLYQLNVRPIRLYEIAFPEEMKDLVIPMISPNKMYDERLDKFVWPIRKMLGLEKVPEFKPQIKEELKTPGEWLNRKWVDCMGIGIKKDRFENGIEQL